MNRLAAAHPAQSHIEQSNLLTNPAFDSTIRANVPAVPPLNTETDTTAVGKGPYYYRVRLE